jgi:hypothetical protein
MIFTLGLAITLSLGAQTASKTFSVGMHAKAAT